MNRRWLYPYYVIAVLLLLMWLTGCDSEDGGSQAHNPFSVEVRVENAAGTSAEEAEVTAQPYCTIPLSGEEATMPCGQIVAPSPTPTRHCDERECEATQAALQFVGTTDDRRQQSFRRTVSEGKNTLTLSLTP